MADIVGYPRAWAALNEGRALFPGDREFGQWIASNSLSQLGQADVHPKEREAAMWAAANADQLAEARGFFVQGRYKALAPKGRLDFIEYLCSLSVGVETRTELYPSAE